MAEEIKKADPPQTPTTRYADPFQVMRTEMDRLFDNFMQRGFPSLRHENQTGKVIPNVDVRESDGEIVVEAEMPGLDEKEVDVTLRDGVLHIKGEKKSEREEKKDDYHVTERSYGRYERAFRLPDGVDEDKVQASLKNGVLEIKIPKKPDAVKAERKIAIG